MARANTPAPAPQPAHLSVEQMVRGIERLNKRIDDVEALNVSRIGRQGDPELCALEKSVEETLQRVFGHGTIEYNRYRGAAQLDSGIMWYSEPLTARDVQPRITERKASSLAMLRQAVRSLQEDIEERDKLPILLSENEPAFSSALSRKVFIVHGRDNEVKSEVARFLSKIGLEEVILHERPNAGRHLLTKFQEEANGASFAVVLITPDDEGGMVGGPQRSRARQNVIFELGFFIGKLGASRVAALVKGDVETPSDFDGIGYITLDAAGGWKGLLARELSQARIPLNPAKVFEA